MKLEEVGGGWAKLGEVERSWRSMQEDGQGLEKLEESRPGQTSSDKL
jgi:hypothetical protein